MLRIPKSPPEHTKALANISAERFSMVFDAVAAATDSKRYLHWDQLRHRKPPNGISHEEWWAVLRYQRLARSRKIELKATNGQMFWYSLDDQIIESLHEIDLRGGGSISTNAPHTGPQPHERHLISSLIEESITSSQLEGAATTRKVAKEMIVNGRLPRDQSERMILNNYETMQYIRTIQSQQLTRESVLAIHKHVTRGTLENKDDEGRLRQPGQAITIGDDFGQVFHDPPPASELDDRLAAMCAFANGSPEKPYLHPILRAIILHFWLAYDHPFVDGNGRTARALFYWCMLHNGFWIFEYISISEIILKGPSKYGRAFLYTETDSNDLTYFLLYHLHVIQRAIRQLDEYVERRKKELQFLIDRLVAYPDLNHRQRSLLAHALRHRNQRYSIQWHQNANGVVYQTARTDLLDLASRGLLKKTKSRRTWVFTPVDDLDEMLVGR